MSVEQREEENNEIRDDRIRFESRFESGNLAIASLVINRISADNHSLK